MISSEIKELIKGLTLDEKIRLLNGDGDWHTYDCNGKIPAIMMTDGPHGLRKVIVEKAGDVTSESVRSTCFPTASAVASSWNEGIVYTMASAIAKEALAENVDIVLGCGVNIKRSPLCGRNFEYFSEDPYLTGKLGIAYVNGMQDMNVGTSVKHFAGNSQEKRRMTSNSEIDERALREIYLRAFEMIVKNANPTTLMASYNRLNGDYSCANEKLLSKILREEWGYDGAVISDWGAAVGIVKCIKAGLTLEMPDDRGFHEEIIKKALQNGEITETDIDKAAGEVIEKIVSVKKRLEARDRSGKYKQYQDVGQKITEIDLNGQTDNDNLLTQNDRELDYDFKDKLLENNNEVARQIENECAVLLKNNGALPISKDLKLIVIGELAEKMRYQGGGSSHINAYKVENAIDTLRAAGYDVTYFKGYHVDSSLPDASLEGEVTSYLKGITEGGESERNVVLYFCGLTDAIEGEGFDRSDLEMSTNQVRLIRLIKDSCRLPIVAVTFAGAPMDYSWEDMATSILQMHLGGQAVAESVADIISGKVSPSGHLAETVPLSIGDTPAYRYYAPDSDDVEYRESLFVGYRYYETFDVPVRYPFGYGLSYSQFGYSGLDVVCSCDELYNRSYHNSDSNFRSDKDKIEDVDGNNKINSSIDSGCIEKNFDSEASISIVPVENAGNPKYRVTFVVKNEGKYDAKAVPQIYVFLEKGDFIRSSVQLAGFTKLFLKAGESEAVSIDLDDRCFSVYDKARKDFVQIEGDYIIGLGESVKDIRQSVILHVKGSTYSVNEREIYPEYFENQPHGMEISRSAFEKLYGKELSRLSERKAGNYDLSCSFYDVSRASLFGRIVLRTVKVILRIMNRKLDKNDPARIMMESVVMEGSLEGLIATGGGAIPPGLVRMLLRCANGHGE